MPIGTSAPWLLRRVCGRSGRVAMTMDLRLTGATGRIHPPLNRTPFGFAGGGMALHSPVRLEGADPAVAHFAVAAGDCLTFALGPDGATPPDAVSSLAATAAHWTEWARGSRLRHPLARRALLTLKALIHAPTGAMVAAPTTSLPERPGGSRNWDYRFCWLRDSALVLEALLDAGHTAEATAWLPWLRHVLAGRERVLADLDGFPAPAEREADWLPGYNGARPVRLGNAAAGQVQVDVFGEVASLLARLPGTAALRARLADEAVPLWPHADEGIWEVRGGRRHFTFSKLMAWVALDRAGRHDEAARLHALICADGFDPAQNAFTQEFGAPALDASLLLLPRTGFLPLDDPRVAGTIDAIEAGLSRNGLIDRYHNDDGLPAGEGSFLPCAFWLADAHALLGRHDRAAALFEHLCGLANDVGLFAEECDPVSGTQLGNFPQGLTQAALVRAAVSLESGKEAVLF